MPKQIIEINPFHGGLNNNSDPRDISIDQLSEATDIMVDEVGIVRMMGGNVSAGPGNRTATISSGYGLFTFPHDRVGGETSGSSQADSGDYYIAFANPATTADIMICDQDNNWSNTGVNAPIKVGDGSSTTGLKATYYYSDGDLRVGDAGFASDKIPKWYGYIDRYFFGDSSSGYTKGGNLNRSDYYVDKWYTDEAYPKSIAPRGVLAYRLNSNAVTDHKPTADNPVTIDFDGRCLKYTSGITDGAASLDNDAYGCKVDITGNDTITADDPANPKFTNFIAIGDRITFGYLIQHADNGKIFTVSNVTDTVITVEESIANNSNDHCVIYNLSRSVWFDKDNQDFEIAMTTLYDDSKQESALYKIGTIWSGYLSASGSTVDETSSVLSPKHFINRNSHNSNSLPDTGELTGFGKLKIDFQCYSTDDASAGLHTLHPRVSGFKVYMRRTGDSVMTSDWYLQAEIDVTKGNRWFNKGEYGQWKTAMHSATEAPYCDGEYIENMRQIETYDSETGFDSENQHVGFDSDGTGYKTAVVANRRVYAGNCKIKDETGVIKHIPDGILKSPVNAMDSFTFDQRVEASTNDGDEIVKLEEYADRLLEFKKEKMTIINISQSVEFVEDVFHYKGISSPSSVAKTDYGIVWANSKGCYLYDGKQVTNLLEQKNIQVIKESTWSSFVKNPMVGYIPSKRQVIVVDDNSTLKNGAIYLYDMVTNSWVQGSNGTIQDKDKTNFVTNQDGELMYAYDNSGTVSFQKWDDTSAAGNLKFATKDMTFGQPGQRKKLHKVYLTYKGDGSGITVKYAVDGESDSGSYKQFNSDDTPLLDKSGVTDWTLAELKPTTASDSNSIYSTRVLLEGSSIPADFKINDINIVFRMKNVK